MALNQADQGSWEVTRFLARISGTPARPLRRVQAQPDDVADVGFQLRVSGELERLGTPGLEVVVAPDAGRGVVADAELCGQQPGRPVGDPQVLGWRGKGGGEDLGPPVCANGLGSAWAGAGRPGRPGRPGCSAAATRSPSGVSSRSVRAISVLDNPWAAASRILARSTSAALDRARAAPPVKGVQVFGRDGERECDPRHERSGRRSSSWRQVSSETA
jgi:hypothetical protein